MADYQIIEETPNGGRPMLNYKLKNEAARAWALTAPNKELARQVSDRYVAMEKAFKENLIRQMEEEKAKKAVPPPVDMGMKMEYMKMYYSLITDMETTGDQRDKLNMKDERRNLLQVIKVIGGLSGVGSVECVEVQKERPQELPLTEYLKLRNATWWKGNHERKFMSFCNSVRDNYILTRGHPPPKRAQYVDGAVRQVNHYTTEDIPLIDEVFGRF